MKIKLFKVRNHFLFIFFLVYLGLNIHQKYQTSKDEKRNSFLSTVSWKSIIIFFSSESYLYYFDIFNRYFIQLFSRQFSSRSIHKFIHLQDVKPKVFLIFFYLFLYKTQFSFFNNLWFFFYFESLIRDKNIFKKNMKSS